MRQAAARFATKVVTDFGHDPAAANWGRVTIDRRAGVRRRGIIHSNGATFPFAAIVGQGLMRLSLALNSINPSIGGVMIRGERGTAESMAERGLAAA